MPRAANKTAPHPSHNAVTREAEELIHCRPPKVSICAPL
jgi:hypothetical protein